MSAVSHLGVEPPGLQPGSALRPARPLHHWYFSAAIATVLTVGAGWGVWLLWQLAGAGRFTALPIHDVNAHGQAQIDGWVGLFVMGFALQMFPPVWHSRLVGRRFAAAPLIAMLAGVALRSVGMSALVPGAGVWLALAGSILQVAAAVATTAMLALTYRRSLTPLQPWVGFVFFALLCFIAQAAVDGWHTWTMMVAPTREALLQQVSTFQAPLRNLQVHGLALCMVLGVSLRFFSPLFGLEPVADKRGWAALGAVAVGLFLESALFLVFRWTGNWHWGLGVWAGQVLVAIGCALVVLPWRLWRLPPRNARSAKFIRTAYGWLALSLAMLLLLPGYVRLSGLPFSHAYYGAIRHAVTVGFVSQMIVGMSSLVVPLTPPSASLRATFLLLNLGCALRVGLQVATDWSPQAFAIIGASGVLEFTALAIWAAQLGPGLLGKLARRSEPELARGGAFG